MSDIFEQITSLEQQISDLQRFGSSGLNKKIWDLVVAKDTVLYAPIDGDVNDYSDVMSNGTLQNGAELAVGRTGSEEGAALLTPSDIEGLDPYLFWTPYDSQQVTENFGFAIWFYPLELPETGSYASLFNKAAFQTIDVILESDGQISFSTWQGATRNLIWSGINKQVKLEEWNSLVCTRRIDGLQRIYLNGELSSFATLNPGEIDTNSLAYQVGAEGGIRGFHGLVDDIYLINRFVAHQEALAFNLT